MDLKTRLRGRYEVGAGVWCGGRIICLSCFGPHIAGLGIRHGQLEIGPVPGELLVHHPRGSENAVEGVSKGGVGVW